MSSVRELTGLVTLDGRSLADQRMLLISGDMTQMLGSTTTDEDGRYRFELPAEYQLSQAVLMLKVQGPVIAIRHQVINLDGDELTSPDFVIDSTGNEFQVVEGTIKTTAGWPPYLMIFVNPLHVEGIPSGLETFFNQRDERVVESTFFKLRVEGGSFEIRLDRGTYRIGGDYINYGRPMTTIPTSENYIVSRVDADGESEPLPGNYYSGYLLKMNKKRRILMTIEVFPDENLSPAEA